MSKKHGQHEIEEIENMERREIAALRSIEAQLQSLSDRVDDILVLLAGRKVPTAVQISQGGSNVITGIQAGGAPGVFEADPIPSNVPFPAGTTDTWTSDDPNVTLAPSTTDPTQVQASTPASNTAKDFGLTVSTQMPADSTGAVPAPFTNTVRVPIIPATTAVPTGVQINQIS
jgi:hypothetical protein